MTTDEMVEEIVSYDYKAYGFGYVFAAHSFDRMNWEITWRNAVEFDNANVKGGKTLHEACKNALEFINDNPKWFTKKS